MNNLTLNQLPENPRERDAWILGQRGARHLVSPDRVVEAFVEEECSASGEVVPVAALFLANRECPFRCLMCDLWKNTLPETISLGAIPRQVRQALSQLPPARQIKLYNSGSFFDPRAIPPGDYPAIASLLTSFERVLVECHPAFIGRRCLEFQDQVSVPLEVAIGLETAHPGILEKLNKRMTLHSFAQAVDFLTKQDISTRAFILLRPPFLNEEEGLEWAIKSVDFAFDSGISTCVIIPTRSGNGALEILASGGDFTSPTLHSLEDALAYGIGTRRGRVFADLWDLERFCSCAACFSQRKDRLHRMNLEQTILPPVRCEECGAGG